MKFKCSFQLSAGVFLILVQLLLACSSPAGKESTREDKKEVIVTPAEAYNNYIVGLQDTIATGFMKLAASLARDDANDMQMEYERLGKSLSFSLNALQKLEKFNGDDSLKKAAEELILFYQSVYENEYRRILAIRTSPQGYSMETEKEMVKLSEDISVKEMVEDEKFLRAQAAFARKNNMQLIENPLQRSIDTIGVTYGGN